MEVIQQEEFHEWTDKDVMEANADLLKGPITLVYIIVERNLRPEMLARVGAKAADTTIPIAPQPA
jgi:hypothetical protein